MPEPSSVSTSADLETQFLNALAKYCRGGQAGAAEAYQLAMRMGGMAGGVPEDLTSVLTAALSIEDRNIQVGACCALASMGKAAEGAIPALKACALGQSPDGAPAAAAALGRIPTESAALALIEIIEEVTGDAGTVLEFAFRALRHHVGHLQPHMPRLEGAFGVLSETLADPCSMDMDAIRISVRENQAQVLEGLELPGFFDLTGFLPDGTPMEEDSALHRDLPIGQGDGSLVVDERFRFRLETHGDVRVRIFRIGAAAERALVVFSEDGESYGLQGEDILPALANAVSFVYGLDSAKTVWGVHVAQASGHAADHQDEYYLVRFGAYDSGASRLSGPHHTSVGSLQELIESARNSAVDR